MTSRRRVAVVAAITLPIVVAAAQAEGRPGPLTQAGQARCRSAQLVVRVGRLGVALGHVGVTIDFKNVSKATCTLYGYPGLQMQSAAGQAIPTDVLRGTAYTVPSMPERTVTLVAHAEAAFDLGFADSTGYGLDKCPTSARVEITPPNAYRPITISWRIQPYGGGTINHLRCGQITVSPVFAER
jgi:hypothetical protein